MAFYALALQLGFGHMCRAKVATEQIAAQAAAAMVAMKENKNENTSGSGGQQPAAQPTDPTISPDASLNAPIPTGAGAGAGAAPAAAPVEPTISGRQCYATIKREREKAFEEAKNAGIKAAAEKDATQVSKVSEKTKQDEAVEKKLQSLQSTQTVTIKQCKDILMTVCERVYNQRLAEIYGILNEPYDQYSERQKNAVKELKKKSLTKHDKKHKKKPSKKSEG